MSLLDGISSNKASTGSKTSPASTGLLGGIELNKPSTDFVYTGPEAETPTDPVIAATPEEKGILSIAKNAGKSVLDGVFSMTKAIARFQMDQMNAMVTGPKKTIDAVGDILSETKPFKEAGEGFELMNQGKVQGTKSMYITQELLPALADPAVSFLNLDRSQKAIKTIGASTSNIPLKLISAMQATGQQTYDQAYAAWLVERNDPTNKTWEKFIYEVQDALPQSAIGVALSLSTTALTRNPIAGYTVSGAYYTALSANEQIENNGKVYSLGNIGIDVVGDQVLSALAMNIVKVPAGQLVKEISLATGIEGTTEVAQSLAKYSNDYANAKTEEEKQRIISELTNYIKNGGMAMEFAVGAVSGGVITGVAGIGGQISNPSVQPQDATTKRAPMTEALKISAPKDIEKIRDAVANGAGDPESANDPEFVRAADLMTTYAQTFSERTLYIPSTDSDAPMVSVSVLPFPDGKFAVSFEANTANNGISGVADFSTLHKSPEDATAKAIEEITAWAKTQIDRVADAKERAQYQNVINALKNPDAGVSPSKAQNAPTAQEAEKMVKDMNRGVNERGTSEMTRKALSGELEGSRLDLPENLQRAKDYAGNNISVDATPETMVRVYRAGSIEAGSYVTLSEKNAKKYASQGRSDVTSMEVPARDLVHGGGLGSEFIYAPKKPSAKKSLKEKRDEKKAEDTHLEKAKEALRKAKGLSASDIMKTYPDIELKRDVPVTDIHGKKSVIPEGEALTPYELKGNKVLLQDGETYIVSKNQFANIKGNAITGEAKEFAPEMKDTEETVKGKGIAKTEKDIQWTGSKDDLTGKLGSRTFGIKKEYDGYYVFEQDGRLGKNVKNYTDAVEEVNRYLQSENPSTKYESYTLPGGENYKEILVKAPLKKVIDLNKLPEGFRIETGKDGSIRLYDNDSFAGFFKTEKDAIQRAINSATNTFGKDSLGLESGFKSAHWSEPNVLFHLRMNERTVKGKKVAFMEELQSDWARKVRTDEKMAGLPDRLKENSHPLLKKWETIAVKRALKEAVDIDAEYFAWINGEQTSARYNLATHVKDVSWDIFDKTNDKEKKAIRLHPQSGKEMSIYVDKNGTITSSPSSADWEGKKLDEVLGKGLADKIMGEDSGTLSGEGLKFGGEWANNLYDKQVGVIVRDLTGAKIETLDMGLSIKNDPTKFIIQGGRDAGGTLTQNSLKVGLEINIDIPNGATDYVVTDVLKEGKFNAVPKNKVFTKATYLSKDLGYKELNENQVYKKTDVEKFDLSSKTTTQQGIRLTDEVKRIIRGEAPEIKKPSGREPFKETEVKTSGLSNGQKKFIAEITKKFPDGLPLYHITNYGKEILKDGFQANNRKYGEDIFFSLGAENPGRADGDMTIKVMLPPNMYHRVYLDPGTYEGADTEEGEDDAFGKVASNGIMKADVVLSADEIKKEWISSSELVEKKPTQTLAQKRTINAFSDSKDQTVVGKIGDAEIVIGSYGRNAIVRKTDSGKEHRLPVDQLPDALRNAKQVFKAGNDGFRKDNLIVLSDLPSSAIVLRKNAQGKEEVINFFAVPLPVKYAKTLETFGAPDRSRTDIFSLEGKQSNPLAYGDKESVSKPAKKVKQAVVSNQERDQYYAQLYDVYNATGPSNVDGFTKADEELNGLLMEIDLAEAGQRSGFMNYSGPGLPVYVNTSTNSTFPKWIDEDLRSKELFDKVFSGIERTSDLKYPSRPNATKQRIAFNAMLDQLDVQLGIDTKDIRSNIMKTYGKNESTNKAGLEAQDQRGTAGGEGVSGRTEVAKKEAVQEKGVTVNSSQDLGFNPLNITDPMGKRLKEEKEKIVQRQAIARDLATALGTSIRMGKFSGSAVGIFKQLHEGIRLKSKFGGLPTIFHESGHFIDKKLNISGKIPEAEVNMLMKEYGVSYEGQPSKRQKEAFAELVRYYMTGQEERVKNEAPVALAQFMQSMNRNPEIFAAIEKARTDYARWKEMPAAQQVFSHLEMEVRKPALRDRLSMFWHDLYTNAIDDLHPIEQFAQIANERESITAQKDPYKLARLMRGWTGRAESFLTQGTFGKKFWKEENGKIVPNYTGKSLQEILKPVDNAGEMNDFRSYLLSRRAIELHGRKDADGKPAPIISGIDDRIAREALKELNEKYPHFEQAANDFTQYLDHVMTYAVEKGLISKKSQKAMRELNRYYVPFYRAMITDEGEAKPRKFLGKRLGNSGQGVKKIKGSDLPIVDPIESAIKNTYMFINLADRNEVGVAMANLASNNPELARLFEKVDRPMEVSSINVAQGLEQKFGKFIYNQFPVDLQIFLDGVGDIMKFTQSPVSNRPNDITVYIDGTPTVFHADAEIFKSMQGLNTEDVGMVMRILSTPASFLRAGATLTPEFILRNPLRDQFSAWAYSQGGFIPGVDMMKGAWSIISDQQSYELWKMSGGEMATLVSIDRKELQMKLEDLMKSRAGRLMKFAKNPIEIMRMTSAFTEEATRLGEMQRVLAKTKDPLQAGFASREITLDFNRVGAKTRAVNNIVAFWNANVQGTDKMIRSLRRYPFQTLLKIFLGITLPSILLWLASHDDPRYQEIPDWQKNLFWIVIPTHISREKWDAMSPKEKAKFSEDHPIWRIPKPFELGIIFGSAVERTLDAAVEKKDGAYGDLMLAIGQGATPGIIPTAMLPVIENISNYSFFLDRPIVPSGKTDLPSPQQYSTYTSESAKLLGEKLNVSPAKLDNLIQGYFGGLGKYATNATDKILKGSGVTNPVIPPKPSLADMAAVRAFVVRSPMGSGSQSVNTFYNLYAESTQGSTYVKQLIKQERVDEAKAYLAEHPEILRAKELSAIAKTFSEIRKASDMVYRSKTLTPEEKRTKIGALDALMTDIAYKALNITPQYAEN